MKVGETLMAVSSWHACLGEHLWEIHKTHFSTKVWVSGWEFQEKLEELGFVLFVKLKSTTKNFFISLISGSSASSRSLERLRMLCSDNDTYVVPDYFNAGSRVSWEISILKYSLNTIQTQPLLFLEQYGHGSLRKKRDRRWSWKVWEFFLRPKLKIQFLV